MLEKPYKKLIISLSLLVIGLLIFNSYYFFIGRERSPSFYIQKILNKPKDNIVDSAIYKDLREEYFYLNRYYNDEMVTVFIGDSITKRFNLQEYSKSKKILNRGIFSDTTYGLLQRLDENVNSLNVDKVFVMIGYNDLEYRGNDEIVNNIKQILDRTKSNEKYLQSILPVSSERKEINKRIELLNNQLKKVAVSKGYVFIDLHSRFKSNHGGINPNLTRDGTHPNYYGYQLWFTIIKSFL